jgi:uncharacterized protein (TIGR02186 family)
MMFVVPVVRAQEAAAPDFIIDLAEDHVDITTGFNGAKLVLFGVKDKPGNVAVVVRGPLHNMVVRRKEQVGKAWLNRQSMKFRKVPVYYDYALGRDEKDNAVRQTMVRAGIGLDALYFTPDESRASSDVIQNFREALVRTKQAEGLYPLKPKAIQFLADNFFRVAFYLPSNLPVGDYSVESFLIDRGQISERHVTHLRVEQVGTGAEVAQFSRRS